MGTTQALDLRAPSWLTRRQKLLWRKAVDSAPAGLLHEMDTTILTTWVIACDTHRDACEKMRHAGLIVKTRETESVKTAKDGSVTREKKGGMPIQNPYLPIINKQAQIMVKAASELGFTPISRTRLLRADEALVPKLTDEPMGKKAKADAAAVTAQVGTEWNDLLQPGSTPLQ